MKAIFVDKINTEENPPQYCYMNIYRSKIKKPVITIPYGVTPEGIYDQLAEFATFSTFGLVERTN